MKVVGGLEIRVPGFNSNPECPGEAYDLIGSSLVAIIEGPKGIIITDDEGVHRVFSDRNYKIAFNVAPHEEGTIQVIPTERIAVTIKVLMDEEHEEQELGEFVRRFGTRIEQNYGFLLKTIEEFGLNPDNYLRGAIKKEPKAKRRIASIA